MEARSHDSEQRLARALVTPQTPISTAIPILDRTGLGILLLCDDERRLVGALTDGDIRRAIINGVSLNNPCSAIASRNPLTAPLRVSLSEALRLMDHGRAWLVNHLPVVDDSGVPVDLILRSDLVSDEPLGISAVIMAGGYGKRLHPLTEEVPKPMLPVGDRPLMELLVEQLRQSGIGRVKIATHFCPERIIEHFADGRDFGVQIDYLNEDLPLGTAGALGLLDPPSEPLLIVNGDLLTNVDFRAMLAFHCEHNADLTVGIRQYDFQIPYGVVDCDGLNVIRIREKPCERWFVNAGIYLLAPGAHRDIPPGMRCEMTDLIERLITNGRKVVSFPIIEYWMDVGRHRDYERALEAVSEGELIW